MHTIRCEIDAEYSGTEALADLAWRWLTEGADRLEDESFQGTLDSTGQVEESLKKSVPCGPPGTLWGFLSVTSVKGTGRGVSNRSRVLTRKNLPMLRKWLVSDVQLAETAVYQLDDRGMPGQELLRMGVARDEDGEGWIRLSAEAPKERFASAQLRWTELLRDFAEEVDPSYAQIGYSLSLGRTEYEERVGPLLPYLSLAESRQLLRGYEWLMVIPREIAQLLGGADGITAAGDFHRIETLRDGAVLLQVTPEFDDFTGEAIERTWRLLRPALRPGMPKRFEDSDLTGPPSRIWYADIA
ncbi:DUF3396 domain-containing protein [Streptomyces sp. So13.3]|uniref:DUF3396 domain-containing protein n=1 Tax=Streptomyces sp. So13.3 TaxID=2136173 RepID=UPI0011061360|nr:DUF3396 domain-containing protein [Streptomyces sp. So13.3]QNA72253.1 DUF3396 domain-containing protein [Streptomyces sp. So13.3]